MSTENNAKKDKDSRKSVFGRTLAALRKAHHLTQEQVADILKIKRSTYAYYERDVTPTLENIKKLAVLFNTTVHFLLYGVEEDMNMYEPKHTLGGTDEGPQKINPKDLRTDEALMIGHYRLLPPNLKEKIYKEIKDTFDKAE